MKIVVDYNDAEIQDLKIETAKYLGNFIIEINFSDGFTKKIDFKHFLSKSNHPSIEKYLEEQEFIQYQIIEGNLNWNDYEMIFPIYDLYIGKI